MDLKDYWTGMQPWKLNREVYYRTNTPTDYIGADHPYVVELPNPQQLIDGIVDYFITEQAILRYPYKSYAVAVIYSVLLFMYFDEHPMTSLADPELLPDDRYFSPLTESNRYVYLHVWRQLLDKELTDVESNPLEQVQRTISCFKEEFMVN